MRPVQTGAPMQLFFSYGHDDNQDFVRRIKRDLEQNGQPCWIDSEQIHKQPDWRRSLMDGLRSCTWTVGFLSRSQAARYAEKMAALDEWLKPVAQRADIAKHLDGFVGRDWLLQALEQWRLQQRAGPADCGAVAARTGHGCRPGGDFGRVPDP